LWHASDVASPLAGADDLLGSTSPVKCAKLTPTARGYFPNTPHEFVLTPAKVPTKPHAHTLGTMANNNHLPVIECPPIATTLVAIPVAPYQINSRKALALPGEAGRAQHWYRAVQLNSKHWLCKPTRGDSTPSELGGESDCCAGLTHAGPQFLLFASAKNPARFVTNAQQRLFRN